MPLCPRCSAPFTCTCARLTPKKLGETSGECPLPKPGAIWVHVVDDRGIDVPGVTANKEDDRELTASGGTAVFDSVPNGPHSVVLEPLSRELLVKFEKFNAAPRVVNVSPGQIAYVPYQLMRRPTLSVKVVLKGNPGTTFEGATVKASGPGDPAGPLTNRGGVSVLENVSAGEHSVSVELKAEDQKKYVTTLNFQETTAKVTLGAGQKGELLVEVEEINVVTASVKIEPARLVIDHWPGDRESVTGCVEMSLRQTNPAHRYEKKATFICTGVSDVEAFLDEACSASKKLDGALESGIELPEPEQELLRQGKTVKVFLRGDSKPGALAITLALEVPGNRFVKLGEAAPPAEAEVVVLARPHVSVEWLDGGGVDGVKVALNPDSDNHLLPDSVDSGLAKWAKRGIKPGLYACALKLPGDIPYLLHSAEGVPLDKASIELKPGATAFKFKIGKVKATLAITCETGGVAEDIAAKVTVKGAGEVVLPKSGGPKPVEIPITVRDQKCEVEGVTLDPDEVCEMVEVVSV